MKTKRITKQQVREAMVEWCSAVERSINPDVDLAVSHYYGKYLDIKAQYEAQQKPRA